MYAGSHGLTDALDSVIDAAAKLDRSLPGQFRFRLIGRGPAKAGLQRRAQEQGIGNVVFEDPVPKSEMPSILAQANAFIIALKQTDLYQYGISPNKLHEYMAAARPTILAGDCPHNPIREAGAGLTVAPEDAEAIARAAKELASMSDEQRTWIGLRGRQYVEEFHDFSKLADSLESVLLRVIETGESVDEINDGIRGRKLPTLGV
jgi:glycosyltransferase involved in cell wall biosynthesis